MGIAVAIGVFGGRFLDDWLNTKPVMFWIGLALGFAAAAKGVYDAIKLADKVMMEEDGTKITKKD